MLHGILNMSPDLWSGDAIDVMQRHGRYKQASIRITDDEREIERLREGLRLITCEPINAEYIAQNILDGLPAYHDTMIVANETPNAELRPRAGQFPPVAP